MEIKLKNKNDKSKKINLKISIKNFLIKRFPGKMAIFFIIAIGIKLLFFAYGVYCYNNNISPTIDGWFSQFAAHWWDLEGLSDFKGDYILFRNNFLNGETLYSEAFKGRYLYPPVYYYLISILAPFTIFAGPITMLICNIFTGYFVYHIVVEWGANRKAAQRMMLLTMLSPINLYYSDFIWQNAGVFTTFVMWSLLLLSRKKYNKSMIILGLAIGIKQVAAFYLPFFVFAIIYQNNIKPKLEYLSKYTFLEYLRSINWSALIFYSIIPIEVFLIVSLPYIITIPSTYLYYITGGYGAVNPYNLSLIFSNMVRVYVDNGVFVGIFPDLSKLNPDNVYRVNYRAALDTALAMIGVELGWPSYIWIIFSILFHSQIFLYVSVLIILLLYWRILKNNRNVIRYSKVQLKSVDRKNNKTNEKDVSLTIKNKNEVDLDINKKNADKNADKKADKNADIIDEKNGPFLLTLWYAASLSFFACLLFVEKGIYKYYFISMTPTWAIFSVLGGLNYKGWVGSKKGINWQYGGGNVFHIIEQITFQLLLMYGNKWLLPIYLYLPLFIIMLIRLWIAGNPDSTESKIETIDKLAYFALVESEKENKEKLSWLENYKLIVLNFIKELKLSKNEKEKLKILKREQFNKKNKYFQSIRDEFIALYKAKTSISKDLSD